MANVLGECITEEQRCVVRFLWSKGLNAKDIRKEMFPVYGGKYLSCKAVLPGSRNSLKDVWKSQMMRREAELTQTTVKRFLCCGFWRTGKGMGQLYQWWWRICREINVFHRFDSHMFYVLYQFVTYLLTLPRMLVQFLTLKSTMVIVLICITWVYNKTKVLGRTNRLLSFDTTRNV
jgi:hypothetical protein